MKYLFSLLLLVFVLDIHAQQNKYYISTCDELMDMSDPNGYYELTNAIDCYYNNSPIQIPFSGELNGNGFSIINLSITASEDDPDKSAGLFKLLVPSQNGDSPYIHDIVLYGGHIYGGSYLGAIASKAYNAIFENIYATNVQINHRYEGSYRGGLVGYAENSSFDRIDMHAPMIDYNISYAGGLIGHAHNSSISNATLRYVRLEHDSGPSDLLSRTPNGLGGLAGRFSQDKTFTSISNVHIFQLHIGPSFQPVNNVGGLVGILDSVDGNMKIERSSVIGGFLTCGGANIGGLVGNFKTSGEIINSYSQVDIEEQPYDQRSRYVGGIIGKPLADKHIILKNVYATGLIDADGKKSAGRAMVGSTSEKSHVVGIESFFDKQATGKKYSGDDGSKGMTTKQMQDRSTYVNWSESIWTLVEGKYPDLKNKYRYERMQSK